MESVLIGLKDTGKAYLDYHKLVENKSLIILNKEKCK